jgi:sodium transport system ATP-binding protein
MSGPLLSVRGLTASYGDAPVLRGLDFDIAEGGAAVLIGANGAGKTTTLRMIAGVLKPDAGAIRVGAAAADGDARPNARVAAARLGALLDHTGLYPRLTARENLRYFARLRGLTGAALETHVERVLQQLDLTEIADRRTAGFSQGQRMKVALGRALINEPTHLLLDEPTSGLDVPTVRKLRGLLAELRDAGTCVLFSSHVLTEVESLCDRIVVMAGGDVVGQGTCDELCRSTATTSLEEAFLTLTGEYGEATC